MPFSETRIPTINLLSLREKSLAFQRIDRLNEASAYSTPGNSPTEPTSVQFSGILRVATRSMQSTAHRVTYREWVTFRSGIFTVLPPYRYEQGLKHMHSFDFYFNFFFTLRSFVCSAVLSLFLWGIKSPL